MAAIPVDASVAVVGAGIMGAGIAQLAAGAGHSVLLYDQQPGATTQALDRIGASLTRLVEKQRIDSDRRDQWLAGIRGCEVLSDLSGASLVVEAVREDLQIKRSLFAALEDVVSDDAILATNTSSLSITAIAAGLRRPGRLAGMHFFNPVAVMRLVEIVSGLASAKQTTRMLIDTATAWGKTAVQVRSTPGFIVNRVARPFYAEALRVLQEQAADAATVDAVMREAGGFRMGPCELMDLIGHDVNFAVTRAVFESFFHDPRFTPSLLQQELVEAGFLGRKSGRGFYNYEAGSERPSPHTAAPGRVPGEVGVVGRPGILETLLAACPQQGMTVRGEAPDGVDGYLLLDARVRLALTDGRSATRRMVDEPGAALVLVDLALDMAGTDRVAVAPADQCSGELLALACGFLQKLGKKVSVIDDLPGMIVMRTVCMLANEAADAVNQGVANAADVDAAMCRGVNYPLGPLAWAQRLGVDTVVRCLDHLALEYGEDRYRVSPLLRRRALGGGALI